MDVLARLRSDMDDAGHDAEDEGEDVTVACIDILDEFIAAHEVLRTVHYPEKSRNRRYYAEDDGPEQEGVKHVSIIVPRERKPSVLEAMEAAHRWLGCFCRSRGEPGITAEGARDVLAEAIEKEKSDA